MRKKINLNLSEEQFRTLLDLVLMGEHMVNGIRVRDEFVKEYEEFLQLILKVGFVEGLDDLVKKDPNSDSLYPAEGFVYDGRIGDFLEEYEEEIFWQDLTHALFRVMYQKLYGNTKTKGRMLLELLLDDPDLHAFVEDELENNGIVQLAEFLLEKYKELDKKEDMKKTTMPSNT